MQYSLTFPTGTVKYIFQARFGELGHYTDTNNCILLIDRRVAGLYPQLFAGYRQILIDADEVHKSWAQAEYICGELLNMGAHRGTTLVGIGGGITTDLTGFVASVFIRGINFGYVPTTLLGMCDAAIGGKNGVNLGLHKNLMGTIQQPSFIFYDAQFLQTLSDTEWANGFAEVIKYACLFDKPLFDELSKNDITYYRNNAEQLQLLIERCVDWKNKVVMSDEKESGQRKLLNFGHTFGHAVETLYQLPHGFAVAIGMVVACLVSTQETGLDESVTLQLVKLLEQYHLPVTTSYDVERVMQVLSKDKKRNNETISYILLKEIGAGTIAELPLESIRQYLEKQQYAGSR